MSIATVRSTTQKIGGFVGGNISSLLSKGTGPGGRVLTGIDDETISSLFNPTILANVMEGWVFDIIFSPGFSMLGQLLSGVAAMTLGPRFFASTDRGKRELALFGAQAAGALLRSSPGEWSAMFSELSAAGRLALANPRAAALVPFQTPTQAMDNFRRKANLGRLGSFGGLGRPAALQTALDNEFPVQLPNRPARIKIA